MAVQVASLEAIIDLDLKNFNATVKKADSALKDAEDALVEMGDQADKAAEALNKMGQEGKRGFDKTEAGADDAAGGIAGLGKELLGMGGFATLGFGAIIAGIVAVGKSLVDLQMEYSGAMRKLSAQTGKTGAELQELGDIGKSVFADNWGDSIGDAIDAVGQVSRVLGETGDALEASTAKALLFRDVFDISIPESTRAVRSAVQSFGRESSDIFDMMTTVIQNVGDPAQDLADTVNEYSTVFAQAGFSAEEMFGILQEGVRQGARNFDVIADAVKEFTIRIQDGSDTTAKAMDDLFSLTTDGESAFYDLKIAIFNTEDALKANEQALKDSEGAYKGQERVVKDLEQQLKDAERTLDQLAHPKLKGMEEFDDQIFALEQDAKRAQLALLDLEPDTKAYERTTAELDKINDQIDRVTLQRDLIFDEQLRNIEKAAKEGTEPLYTYEEALQQIAGVKGRITDLYGEFNASADALDEMGANTAALRAENEQLVSNLDELQTRLANAKDPVAEFFGALAEGRKTGRDAMSEVIQMLSQVDDELTRNQIGVALFGTKWEDLGPKVILSLDPAKVALTDFKGATDEAADAVSNGLAPATDSFLRKLELGALDKFGEFFERIRSAYAPAFERLGNAWERIQQALGLSVQPLDAISIILYPLEVQLDNIATLLEIGAAAANLWAKGIEWVAKAAGEAAEKLPSLEGVGNSITAAWAAWIAHSPPPLAEGIEQVKDALSSFDTGQVMVPASSGGNNITNLNLGSMGNFTFQGARGKDEALALMLQMLRGQLEAA